MCLQVIDGISVKVKKSGSVRTNCISQHGVNINSPTQSCVSYAAIYCKVRFLLCIIVQRIQA